ncbi:MAG: sodium/proline symporter PutP [Clostridiales bacterium]|nr:sodium/proline symporter PutP [Clostridiales bacterium]
MGDSVWIIVAFLIYAAIMIFIGAFFFKRSSDLSNYFLGGRKLNSWVAAMSAQASDMSGWLLMGLPGAVYAFGTGQLWIAVGLAIGTALNWVLVAKRLRRYTIVAKNSITIPEYLENRFHDTSRILRVAAACFITLFFAIYTASGFVAGGTLFSQLFGIDYNVALLIGVLVILIYTFLGGFSAVCWTDLIQGLLMLAAIIAVPLLALAALGGMDAVTAIVPSDMLDPLNDGSGNTITAVSIISQLAWGLGYFGMPHILIRFMAIKSESRVKRSAAIAIVWVVFTLIFAIIVGVVGQAFTPGLENPETVFIQMIQSVFMGENAVAYLPLLAGFFLCGILAAIMSTADSQLLVTASSITSDIYKTTAKRDATDKHYVWVSRIAVVAVAVIAFVIALDHNSNVMSLVSNAWAGFGSAFGALILLSLYWKRINRAGAAAAIIAGGLTVIVWDYIPFAGTTIGDATELYSLAPGFAISLVFGIVVSLMTKPPSEEMMHEFERTQQPLPEAEDVQEA